MPTGKPTKLKPCKICGELFLPEKPSSRICSKQHITQCPICGKEMVWNTTRKVEPCSKECRKELTKRNNIAKYGVAHPMQSKEVQQHHKQAMLDKYGVESPLQSEEIKQRAVATNQERFGTDWALGSEEVRQKSKDTMEKKYGGRTTLESAELVRKVRATNQERYGYTIASKSEEVKQHTRETNRQRYGVENPMQCPEIAKQVSDTRKEKMDEILAKCKSTWIDTLGVDNPSRSPVVIDKITETFLQRYGVKRAIHVPEFREKMIHTMMERYGSPYYCMTEDYKSDSHFRISKVNKDFASRLDNLGIQYEFEYRIGMKSYDIRLTDSDTLIEIDPTYTHNIIGNHWNRNGLDENYHRDKSRQAEDSGYRCIHVFDWDDKSKIINMITSKKRLYARQLDIWKLNVDVVNKFLNEHHLQGACRGQLLCLGLVKDGEVYQVMTFGKSRYNKNYYIELLRLCTKTGYTVVGGASKLFKFATENYGLHSIISYCDRSKFSGSVYTQIGMKFSHETPPQEIWSKGDKKITANLLRQRGYDQLFGTNYGKGTSNDQLMLENGWLPVYDCGQAVYEYK